MATLEPSLMTLPDPPAVAMGDEPIVSSLFCVETSDPFDSYTHRLESIRFSGRTGYQSVVIAKTYNYGRALFLDGQIQSAEDDEALYHELLVQPAMLRHPLWMNISQAWPSSPTTRNKFLTSKRR